MAAYIAKRLSYGLLVLLGVITLVFFLFNILPGDPARMMLGQRSDVSSVKAIHKELGLDQPVYKRYLRYLNDISPISVHTKDKDSFYFLKKKKYEPYHVIFQTKDKAVVLKKPYLQRSYQSKKEVTEIIAEAFPNTLILALSAITIAMILGIIIGIISALHKNSFFDRFALLIAISGMSVPSFFAAIVIAWLFAFVLAPYTGLNMTGSLYEVDDFGNGEYLQLKNLILPAITLGIRPLAIIIQLTRSSFLEVMSQDYIRTAYAKGASLLSVIRKHALKNALNPVITAITGWFASLLAGAVFVEYIFDWKGLGVVIVDALNNYDFPVLMGTLAFISVILVMINILVDITYVILDPRIQLNA